MVYSPLQQMMVEDYVDFDKAMAAHADWKVKLRVALDNRDSLDADRICSDKNCDLGRWLHGEGRNQCGRAPSFGACVEAHAAFHREAGSVASVINRKDYGKAEQMLAVGSAFSDASTGVAVILRRLKRECASPVA